MMIVGSRQSQKNKKDILSSTCPKEKHHGKHGQKFHPIVQTDGSQIFLVELIKDYTQLPVAYLDDHSFKAISESIFQGYNQLAKASE